MSTRAAGAGCWGCGVSGVAARMVLGGVLVWVGLSKGLEPVEFLKVLRAYDLPGPAMLLTWVAALLPWFEVYCGGLLLVGVAVDGAALVTLGMLGPFTALVFQRGLALHVELGIPLCSVRFDCGCGTGEVLLCGKLAENLALMLLAACLLRVGARSRQDARGRSA